jgi:hypothetical protein
MKHILYAYLLIGLFACSPYKKITVTASDRLTKRWQGATEQAVRASVGPFKERTMLPDGFLLRFDYSYVNILQQTKNSNGFQIKASNQQSRIMTPQASDSYQDHHRSPDDSVIRRMDFYFDKSEHVQSVMATGFPDSVYYVKRR